MIATILPDIPLIIVTIGNMTDVNLSNESFHTLHLFLHSIFPLIFMTFLLIFEKWYFYSATIGYSFHLFLDYITHDTLRMPFYPITNWKIPIFLISYMDIRVIFIAHIIIMILIFVLFRKEIKSFFNYIFRNFQRVRIYLFLMLYIVLTYILAFSYNSTVVEQELLVILVLTLVTTINFFLLSILFLIEIYQEKVFSKYLDKIADYLLRLKSVPSR